MEDTNSDDSNRWVKKHCPKKSADVVGHGQAKAFLKSWLSSFNDRASRNATWESPLERIKRLEKEEKEKAKNKGKGKGKAKKAKKPKKSKSKKDKEHSCMMVSGDHGIGKTCLINVLLPEMGYQPKHINLSKLSGIKDHTNYANKLLKKSSIHTMLTGIKESKFAIVIDNIESIKSASEKKFVESLVSQNDAMWSRPVILISDKKHNKFINKTKKNVVEVRMEPPTDDQMMFLLLRTCNNTQMKLSSKKLAETIIAHCQSDYRRLLSILETLYYTKGSEVISEEDVDECFQFFQRKDDSSDIYQFTKNIFKNRDLEISDTLSLYETERTLHPLMVQQNHVTYIDSCIKDYKTKLNVLSNVTESLALGDIVENHIYEHQMWSIQDSHGFFSCSYPNRIISDATAESNKPVYSKFPIDMNRVSIMSINKKIKKGVMKYFKGMSVIDLLYAKTVMENLIEKEEFDEYQDVISGYNASPDSVKSTIKVDKIFNTKIEIPSEISKNIDIHTCPKPENTDKSSE